MKRLILFLSISLCLCSCSKRVYEPNKSESKQYIEKEVVRTIVDTMEVYIDLPAQSASVLTPDTLSYLKTDYAESYAIWSDGLLNHTLNNLTTPIIKYLEVPHTDTERIVEVTDTVTVSVPYEIEKPIGKWNQLKIDAFWWLLSMIIFVFRKPLIKIVSRLVG